MDSVNSGAPFYIICPDNETTEAMDTGRIQVRHTSAETACSSQAPDSVWVAYTYVPTSWWQWLAVSRTDSYLILDCSLAVVGR
eukprot:COSAG06_NODE_1487_length_9296_cov_19.025226_14_plen_83_part_00